MAWWSLFPPDRETGSLTHSLPDKWGYLKAKWIYLTFVTDATGKVMTDLASTPEMLSNVMTWFIREVERMISSNTGTLPPTRPVFPPCGHTARWRSLQYLWKNSGWFKKTSLVNKYTLQNQCDHGNLTWESERPPLLFWVSGELHYFLPGKNQQALIDI